MRESNKRELVMLAHLHENQPVAGMLVSTKLDGQRCLWDGGVTRGTPKIEVPWANNNKDERYLKPPVATGLWSRYGNVIHAPDWFLDTLPKGVMLDGELYLGRGLFQQTRSIVSRLEPDDRWKQIRYMVFDMPSPTMLFQKGQIRGPQFEKYIVENDCIAILKDRVDKEYFRVLRYAENLKKLQYLYTANNCWNILEQTLMPSIEDVARERLADMLAKETALKGEGLIIRNPQSIWHPKRTDDLLKVVKFDSSEAQVIGYTAGKGKLQGLFGTLIVEWKGKTFEIGTGFTEAERAIVGEMRDITPGDRLPASYFSARFNIGSEVRFLYKTLTDEGIPREARYFR